MACGQIDSGDAATVMASRMADGAPRANGTTVVEPRLEVRHVAEAVLFSTGRICRRMRPCYVDGDGPGCRLSGVGDRRRTCAPSARASVTGLATVSYPGRHRQPPRRWVTKCCDDRTRHALHAIVRQCGRAGQYWALSRPVCQMKRRAAPLAPGMARQRDCADRDGARSLSPPNPWRRRYPGRRS